MRRINTNKFVTAKRKNESVEDPHELLLSLVDLGSLDADEALLACVSEMSDAECKRVLSSLSLPECCEETEDGMSVEVDPMDDEVEFTSDEEMSDEDASEEVESEDKEMSDEEVELEARIRRLEKCLRSESMNRNRIRRFSRHKTNH